MSEKAEEKEPRRKGTFKKGDPRIGGYHHQRKKKERLELEEKQKILEAALGEKLVKEYETQEGEAQLLSDMRWVYKNPDAATKGSRRVLKRLLVDVPKEFVAQLARLEEAQAKRDAARAEVQKAQVQKNQEMDEGSSRALEILTEEFPDAVVQPEVEGQRGVQESPPEKGPDLPQAQKPGEGAEQARPPVLPG